MHLRFALPTMMIVFLFLGCKKSEAPGELPYDLIIEGGLSTYSTRQFVKLTKPALLGQKTAVPVSNAKVSINDGQNEIILAEISSTGVYSGIVTQNKNYFSNYILSVEYNGKEYNATDLLMPVYPIDATYIPVSVTPKPDGLRLNVPKHTFGTTTAQQWLILTQGSTWSHDKFKENYPFSYSHFFGTPNALHPLIQQARIIDLGVNDSVNIYKFSLSIAYSTYLYNLFQETDWKGLLSSVPGNVKGNVSGNAGGFFYATDVEMQKLPLKSLIGR